MRKTLLILTSIVWVMLAGVAWAANLVTNPGFETGDFTGWTQSGNTDYTLVNIGNAHSGSHAAQFGPVGSLGFISQDLTTVSGGTYDLTFWLQNRLGNSNENEYQVYWGEVLLTDDIIDSPFFPYTEISFGNLTASSSSTELKFGFRNGPSWFDLDDVSVSMTSVPEPATMLLLGSGLIALWGFRKKPGK
jgi:hypothetical protein